MCSHIKKNHEFNCCSKKKKKNIKFLKHTHIKWKWSIHHGEQNFKSEPLVDSHLTFRVLPFSEAKSENENGKVKDIFTHTTQNQNPSHSHSHPFHKTNLFIPSNFLPESSSYVFLLPTHHSLHSVLYSISLFASSFYFIFFEQCFLLIYHHNLFIYLLIIYFCLITCIIQFSDC